MGPAHCFQDLLVYVLERDIEVWEDFIAVADGFNQSFGYSRGVEIEESEPAESRDFGEVGEQFWQGVFNPNVAAISGDVLCDDIELDCVRGDEFPRFGEDKLFRFASRFAPDGGDGAEGAFFAASLADTEICPVRRGDAESGAVIIGDFEGGGYGGNGFIGCEGRLNYLDDVVA